MRKMQILSMAMVGAFALPAFAQDTGNDTTVAPQPNPPAPVIMHNTTTAPAPVVVQPVAPQPQQPQVVVNPNANSMRDTEVRTRAYPGLIWGGASVFALSYGAAVIGAAASNDACREGADWACAKNRNDLYIPIAGPFMAMGDVSGSGSSTAKTLLALDGVFQAAGVAMSLTGIIMSAVPTQAAQRSMEPVAKKKQKNYIITPYATGTSTGIGAMGRW